MSDPCPLFGNILIVDDLPDNLRVLSEILEGQAYKVRKAINGKTAIRSAQSTPPDLILLDIKMPEMDGYEVCAALKADIRTQDIPIIFISALDDVLDKVRAFQVGGVDYVTKPFHAEEVLARIATQLTLQQQKQQLQHEIEQRREAEEVLHQSRALLSSVLNSSRDGIAAMQAVRESSSGEIRDFRCVVANPVIAHLVGQRKEDLLGKLMVRKFLNRVDAKLFDAFVAVVEEGDPLEQQFCHANRQGEEIWYGFTAIKLGDGFAITIHDITRQQEAILSLQDENEELAELSTIDGLTEIANRRYGDGYLQQQWESLSRTKASLALILCDVDCFKQYNDTYGHQAGDECLRTIAHTMKGFLGRPNDLLLRYGGEEFLAVLPNADENWAVQVAELIRTAIEALNIEHNSSFVLPQVTVSLGVASLKPSAQQSPDELVSMADQALYNAKQTGRNRTIIYHTKFGEGVEMVDIVADFEPATEPGVERGLDLEAEQSTPSPNLSV
ncbi:MAG: diguanylate cyclase [Spirulina sp. SIO3F2]|nr:diguanylate cyclase [Spirulina sp. SIO3F2]